jgi:hypothetical protein
MEELSTIISPGARQAAWPIKIVSHVAYNAYMVSVVVLGPPGTTPLEIGEEMEAINLWEDPAIAGWYPVGGYAIMFRTHDRNFFYGVPFFG